MARCPSSSSACTWRRTASSSSSHPDRRPASESGLTRSPAPRQERSMDLVLQQVINGLTIGAIYAIVALGYTMVYGIIRLINFAHGAVFMYGAYLGLTVLAALGDEHPAIGVPAALLAAFCVPAFVCAGLGFT